MKQTGDYVVETDGQAIPTWIVRMAGAEECISNHDTEKDAIAAIKRYQATDKQRSLQEYLNRRHGRPFMGSRVKESVLG